MRYPKRSMVFRMFSSAAALMSALFVFSPSVSAATSPLEKGEIIHYDIKKLRIKVGEATLVYNGPVEVRGQMALSITFTAQGFQFYDEEQIFLSQDTFYPVVIKRNLNIFGTEERIIEFYDAKNGSVRIVKTAHGKTTEQTITKDRPLDNIYGFIYRHRATDLLSKNKKIQLDLPTDSVRFELVTDKDLKIAKHRFKVCYLRSVPKKYEVWFDKGPHRIPLRIDGASGFGDTSMVFVKRTFGE